MAATSTKATPGHAFCSMNRTSTQTPRTTNAPSHSKKAMIGLWLRNPMYPVAKNTADNERQGTTGNSNGLPMVNRFSHPPPLHQFAPGMDGAVGMLIPVGRQLVSTNPSKVVAPTTSPEAATSAASAPSVSNPLPNLPAAPTVLAFPRPN